MKATLLSRLALPAICLAASYGSAVDAPPPPADLDRQIEMARALFDRGRTEEAKKIYEPILEQLRNRPPTKQLGYVLNAMNKLAAAAGDYERAIQWAEQSAEVYHHLGDAGGESHSWNNKGIAELQLGSYPSAQQDLEKALELSRAGNDVENEVQVLNNLGSAYFFPGDYSQALRRYEEAMATVDRNPNAKWNDYWKQITNINQATLYQRLGRFERALLIYRQVETSSRTLTASDRAHMQANLGTLYRRLGDPYKALDNFRGAQQLYSRQHDADGEIAVLKNIGIVYALDLEDLPRAAGIFKQALALAEKTRNRREQMQAHLYLGETELRAHLLARARAEFGRAHVLAIELNTTEEQWKSLYGLGKIEETYGNAEPAEANYRQAVAVIEKTRSQLQLSALRAEFFADKREAYDALIGLLLHKSDVVEAFQFLERSRSRTFQDHLKAQQGAAAAKSLTLDEVRSYLDPGVLLLEYWTSGNRIGIIWCTHESSGMALKELPPGERTRIREFLDGIPDSLNGNWRERMAMLDALLPQDSAALAHSRHLLVVPDGWISFVPFDLLPVSPGKSSTLIEEYDISYLPSAALLRRVPIPVRAVNWPWTHELVAFGDPSVGQQTASRVPDEREGTGLPRLQHSAEELQGIAASVGGKAQLFIQQDDLKKTFLNGTANHALLLHVSTHAFADGDNPENSRMLFSPPSPGAPPDYVFLRELYDLDLSNVRLATISACDTERGKVIRGEGVQAFSRVLLAAGSRSSLTALWRVDDAPTAAFMRQFYFFALQEHKPKAEALRLAKLKFLHASGGLEDPRLWAAFVLNGDGLTPLPTVLSWATLSLTAGAIFCAALAALGMFLRNRGSFHRQHGG